MVQMLGLVKFPEAFREGLAACIADLQALCEVCCMAYPFPSMPKNN